MAESPKQDGPLPDGAKVEPPKAAPKQNPALRMMGLPNFRFRLPSRNWMIFWTTTGSFAGAIIYDRRQKKKVQKKWCDLVRHVSQEPLAVNNMPRKITVFLSAPPGDGLGPSRQYFKDYIKPVLVAAAMDYDVIEGRKEGDVRYGAAEQIRRARRKKGEQGDPEQQTETDASMAIETMRERLSITPEPGIRGDLVLGRHTWKEYIRGVHEGWLGPLDEPREPEPEPEPAPEPEATPPVIPTTIEVETIETVSSAEPSTEPEKKSEEEKEKEKEKAKPKPPPSYLPISSYESSPLSPHTPVVFEPSVPIHQQHLLGFLKTPQRIYNFLNRRKLADELGREAASLVLAAYRPYEYSESFASTSSGSLDNSSPLASRAPENDAHEVVHTGAVFEQQSVLQEEEPKWHKSIRKPRKEGDVSEQIWLKDIVFDSRIAGRMRRFRLDEEEEARAMRIYSGAEKTRAREIEDLTKEKITVGNIDEE